MDVKLNTRIKIKKMAAAALKTAGCSLSLTILLSFLAGELLSRRVMDQNHSGYAVMLILLSVSAISANVFQKEWGGNILASSAAGGLEYYILLIGITLIFYGGRFEAIGETAMMVAAGSLTAAVVNKVRGKRGHKRRK